MLWHLIKKNTLFPFLSQSCTKDEECCDKQLCVWGQCSHNATRGKAGGICQHQSDCSPDLCCAFHTGTVQRTAPPSPFKPINWLLCKTAPCLCFQSCSYPSAWPSLSSASAALVPPTTWWSFCPGTPETRDPGSTVRVLGISSASTWGESSSEIRWCI